MEKIKDSVIRCRLEKSLHNEFQEICKSKAINISELMRQWIETFVLNNKKEQKDK